jgi:diacylglycerol kinase family enzyme
MSATHLLVGNPTAQSGRNAERIARAHAHLAKCGVAADLLDTLPGGRTIGAVAAALENGAYRCVISMGGDGTFREVAAGLLESGRAKHTAMGMLPTGTANDQGRSFGLDAGDDSLERNVEVIAAARETLLDAGHIDAYDAGGAPVASSWFFDSAGWGISARVLATRNRHRKAVAEVPILRDVYRDQAVYAGALLSTFLESYVVTDKFDAAVDADGGQGTLEGLSDLIVKNTRVYGGAWVLDKTARSDDGLFEVVPFHGKRDWTSKAIVELDGNPLTEEDLNAIGISHSRGFRAGTIALRFREHEGGTPLAAQIDGEEFPATPRALIRVEARAIRLIVPEVIP